MSSDKMIYGWDQTEAEQSHDYLFPPLAEYLKSYDANSTRILDLGCGNGALTHRLAKLGYDVTGVEPSADGIEAAGKTQSTAKFVQMSAYDLCPEKLGDFDIVVSFEVIEHVYDPRQFVRAALSVLKPGGSIFFSTPYHGYLKNIMIALTGKYDSHHNPLWDHGHIKFFSEPTLGTLLREIGFEHVQFKRVGRIPPLAKSMIAIATKPEA